MSDEYTVPGTLTDDFRQEGGEAPLLGPMPIELPGGEGRHVGVQFQTATTMDAVHRQGHFVVLFLGCPVAPPPANMGAYLPMEAREARGLAAALCSAADRIDGGKGKQ